MLRNQKKAFAWDYSEMSCLYNDVMVSVMIRTVKHEAWQAPNFFISQALLLKVVGMLCEQKRFGLLKNCDGFYCNSWFLVKKKTADDYQKMNAVIELNKVIKKNINLLPSVNVFSKEFAEIHCTSFVDMFSEYNQIPLDFCSCDFTAIQTLIGLLKRTWFLQGVMNSVT